MKIRWWPKWYSWWNLIIVMKKLRHFFIVLSSGNPLLCNGIEILVIKSWGYCTNWIDRYQFKKIKIIHDANINIDQHEAHIGLHNSFLSDNLFGMTVGSRCCPEKCLPTTILWSFTITSHLDQSGKVMHQFRSHFLTSSHVPLLCIYIYIAWICYTWLLASHHPEPLDCFEIRFFIKIERFIH